MRKRTTIGTRILGGYLAVIVLLAAASAVSIISLQVLKGQIDEVVGHGWPQADAAMEMNRIVEQIHAGYMEYRAKATATVRNNLKKSLEELGREFEAADERFRAAAAAVREDQEAASLAVVLKDYVRTGDTYRGLLDKQSAATTLQRDALYCVESGLEDLRGSGEVHRLIQEQVSVLFNYLANLSEARVREFEALQGRIVAAPGYRRVAREHQTFHSFAVQAIERSRESVSYANQLDQLDIQLSQKREILRAGLQSLKQKMKERFEQGGRRALAASGTARLVILLIGALATAIGVLIGLALTRLITRPLQALVDAARQVADGDLSRAVEVRSRDEVGELAEAFNGMSGRLNQMMLEIGRTAVQVAASSEGISFSARQLAEGAQSQAGTLEETSAAVEELTASVEQVSDHAQSQAASVEESAGNMAAMQASVQQVSKTLQEVSASSVDSMGKAQGGAEAVGQAVEAMKAIASSSERSGASWM